jgi:hypothetical protein
MVTKPKPLKSTHNNNNPHSSQKDLAVWLTTEAIKTHKQQQQPPLKFVAIKEAE